MTCNDCKYAMTAGNEEPCNGCYNKSKFKPKPKTMERAKLLELLEEKERDIKSLHEKIDKLEKYAKYDECAGEIKAIHDSFVNAGFTESQAFILLTTVIENALRKPSLFG